LRRETKQELATLDFSPPEPPLPPEIIAPGTGLTDLQITQEQINSISRSELERLCDLEYLYCMIYYDLTSMPIRCKAIRDSDGVPRSDPEVQKMYEMGRKNANLESGIRSLAMVVEKIAAIRRASGLDGSMSPPGPNDAGGGKSAEEMTVEEARKILVAVENVPPEKLHLIHQLLDKSARSDT
jgi:hypothetical protein